MLEGKKISARLPRSWKKSINNGVVIPVKMRRCNNQVNENKKFEAILNLLKRHAPNQFGYMLPYYVIKKLSI